MRLGAHLPLADLGGGLPTAGDLVGYATAARELGFATLSANDHLFWKRPWLDGPDGAGERRGRRGGPDPGHQPGAAGGAPPGRGRQDAGLPRRPRAGAGGRRPRPGVEPGRPRGRRHPVRRALGPVRRGPPGGPRAGPRRADRTQPVLPGRGAAGPGAAAAAADLVRQLGVRPAAGCHGVGRGRLVRLGVQRHPGAVRRGPGPAGRAPAGRRPGARRRSPTPWRPPGST